MQCSSNVVGQIERHDTLYLIVAWLPLIFGMIHRETGMEKMTDVTRSLWTLEADMIFLNHGSYGATPKEILSEQQRWRDRLDSQPCRFFNLVAPTAIRQSAVILQIFKRRPDDIVFVENTTSGINAVLNSISFEAGDEVLVSDHIYNAVRNSILFQI